MNIDAKQHKVMLFLCLFGCLSTGAAATDSPLSSAAGHSPGIRIWSVPVIDARNTMVVCVNCSPEPSFKFPGHESALSSLVANRYVGSLRAAMYWQDTGHQMQSKAHFDNCDFSGAEEYIDQLLSEVGARANFAKELQLQASMMAYEAALQKAFFSLGQALHAVQDFYAHSNYVELSEAQYSTWTQVPAISVWTPEGRLRVRELREHGLVSGYVSWGSPKRCAIGSPTHGQLAKDSAKAGSPGALQSPRFPNMTRYAMAVDLAKKDSANLIKYVFEKWPILLKANGGKVGFDVLVDRRLLSAG